eukprot:2656944-Ditylum_brightwellii.AAC.1
MVIVACFPVPSAAIRAHFVKKLVEEDWTGWEVGHALGLVLYDGVSNSSGLVGGHGWYGQKMSV